MGGGRGGGNGWRVIQRPSKGWENNKVSIDSFLHTQLRGFRIRRWAG